MEKEPKKAKEMKREGADGENHV